MDPVLYKSNFGISKKYCYSCWGLLCPASQSYPNLQLRKLFGWGVTAFREINPQHQILDYPVNHQMEYMQEITRQYYYLYSISKVFDCLTQEMEQWWYWFLWHCCWSLAKRYIEVYSGKPYASSIWLASWLFYGVSTLFRSFSAKLNFKQFSLV